MIFYIPELDQLMLIYGPYISHNNIPTIDMGGGIFLNSDAFHRCTFEFVGWL